MNILYISYWGIREGLTQSTVIPHIRILSQYETVSKIVLVTIERELKTENIFINKKTIHIPIHITGRLLPIIDKILEFITIYRKLINLCLDNLTDKIIARGSLAGAIALKVSRNTGIPFLVESFEPHADYMIETGVWSRWSLKCILQKRWEGKQCTSSSGIMTVANGYKTFLESVYHKKFRVLNVPCAVDISMFKLNIHDRESIRKELGINKNDIVGIYVGKFGGLYINLNEVKILAPIFDFFKNIKLIILTSNSQDEIQHEFNLIDKSRESILIKNVPHNEVPKFLSAADFGLSLNKRFLSGRFLSPIKHGEYWANGLPVLMTEGIGDESDFLEKEQGGVLFNEHNLLSSLEKFKKILDDPDHRKKIPELARKYRSFDKVRQAYEQLILP